MVYQACHSVVTMRGVHPPMASVDFSDTQVNLPSPANENIKVKCDWMTPAEALQIVQRIKRKLIRENVHSHTLLKSTRRRQVWQELKACEQCLRWKYFR